MASPLQRVSGVVSRTVLRVELGEPLAVFADEVIFLHERRGGCVRLIGPDEQITFDLLKECETVTS